MSDKDEMSNESKIAYISLGKDLEHLNHRLTEQDKDTEFLKTHISSKHKEQSEKVVKVNDRIDAHIATETEFQQRIHKEILDKFSELDIRMSALEKWKAVIYGGIITIVTLAGYIFSQADIEIK